MKRRMTALLALLLVFCLSLAGCGGKGGDTGAPAGADTETASEPSGGSVAAGEETDEAESRDNGDTEEDGKGLNFGGGGAKSDIAEGDTSEAAVTAEIDDYTVTILGADILESDSGKPCMRFWYDVTNNSEELANVFYNLGMECSQDGVTCSQAFVYDNPLKQNSSLWFAPGKTMRCVETYDFDENGGDVAFQLTGYYGDAVTYYADPKNPSGAPEEEFVITKDESIPDFMVGAPETDGNVEILDVERTEDFNFDDSIKVRFRFTNNEDEDADFFSAYSTYALQDGYELPYAFTSGEDEEEHNDEIELAPGESITFTTYWNVRSDTPVVIVLRKGFDDYFGKVIEID